ncbi:hypothetical protein MNB_SV-6-206 [hydrothermal vent metagenome]|uniref:Cytochrome c domain-containing protein n=1 Tax=hydrothermal vent metagenome TaxID=652676 RepID=A0A1W1BGR9_9ZZZZ
MKSVASTLLLTVGLFGAISGEKVFKEKCSSCHSYYIPQSKLLINFNEHNNSDLNLTAPTLNQLSFAIKDRIGDRKTDSESQKFQIEEYLEEFLNDPSSKKHVVPKNISKFFNPMPSMKDKINEDEVEALADYIYEYGEKMMIEHGVKRYSYDEALKLAKKENKIIVIEGYIPYCRWCIKMDRRVMVDDRVKDTLNKDFLLVKVNLLTKKLPLGIERLSTPSFYFINSQGDRVLLTTEGYKNREDFIKLLKSVKNMSRSK